MDQKIKELAESFFEWPTENKSFVTLTSALLFAEKIAEKERDINRNAIPSQGLDLVRLRTGRGEKMHKPTMEPVLFDAGFDWKLIEANGWDASQIEPHQAPLTVQRFGPKWVAANQAGSALLRPAIEGDPIAFIYGLARGTKCCAAEEALALVAEYLNQPVNPYLWVR